MAAVVQVQVFGTNKSQETKKALRFFKERGIKPQFVDLRERTMAPGELNRFIQKFGLDALVNKNGKAYRDAGLEYMRVGDEDLIRRLLDQPTLMVQPLVRSGQELGLGWDEAQWRAWYEANQAAS